jgi:diadenosine tetraphosphate (Ap4A) HIT family hydrolase
MKRLLRFLLVTVLVQGLTAAQLLMAWRWEQPQARLALAAFAASTALLATLWLASLATHAARESTARASARLALERERAQARAESERVKLLADGERRVARERRRADARANRKALMGGVGLAAVGAVMVLSQFVTLGLLALSSAAGGVGGYLLRARQDRSRRQASASTVAVGTLAGSAPALPTSLLSDGRGAGGFELAPELRRDCVVAGRLPLCVLLLMNDAHYPWFILVPARAGVTEVHQLSDADQQQLLRESTHLARALAQAFAPDKLNIAALGNQVPQLHLHHIARYRTDPAWPAPVWGRVPPRPYAAAEAAAVLERLRAALPVDADFVPAPA